MLQSHTPPILHSPARLGLTNPNSPSFLPIANPNPNPNPIPKPPISGTNSSSSALHNRLSTTSSTLLSLLPPLSRAQSLLIQMASLATKLFEVSPNRAQWLASFRGSLPSFPPANSQFIPAVDLAPVSSTKEVLSLFTSLQTQLFEAVAELQEILDLQDSKVKLTREIRSKDTTLLSFAKKIKEAEQVLDSLVDDYSEYRINPKRPKLEPDQENEPVLDSFSTSSALNLTDILSYAHRISYTTFAPPEFGAGQAPLRGALPPAPQDEQMRASQLYHFANLDLGVPKKTTEDKERTIDTLLETMIEPTPPREEAPMPVPAITVPPGWRKGMPVELPPVPPGWKPGDPVPLPPMDGLVGANRGEEQRADGVPGLTGMTAAQTRPQEPIQVKFVQLDINPDQDEYSSDYSSEVGSSDEDDEE